MGWQPFRSKGFSKIMPKKKSGSFNATQIKDGKIVRLNKNGTIKSVLGDYEVKHIKKDK